MKSLQKVEIRTEDYSVFIDCDDTAKIFFITPEQMLGEQKNLIQKLTRSCLHSIRAPFIWTGTSRNVMLQLAPWGIFPDCCQITPKNEPFYSKWLPIFLLMQGDNFWKRNTSITEGLQEIRQLQNALINIEVKKESKAYN